jgi:ATP dependent DNA ligase domain
MGLASPGERAPGVVSAMAWPRARIGPQDPLSTETRTSTIKRFPPATRRSGFLVRRSGEPERRLTAGFGLSVVPPPFLDRQPQPPSFSPGFISPCLPTKATEPPCGKLWFHEIKHDGFGVIARKDGNRVRLYSRSGNDLTWRFPLIVEALARLRSRSTILDGEAVRRQRRPGL